MTTDLFDLTGKTALVTGSSRGLGLVLARGLGRAGATVVLNGRDEARLAEAVSALEGEGLSVRGHAFDITDSEEVDRAVGAIESEVGPVDVLVNNAGIQRRGRLEEIDEAAWREV
ncbi:MAG: SDR family NAD(P)-dependent oxidoreductase, partial [Planctomycetota bacterium]